MMQVSAGSWPSEVSWDLYDVDRSTLLLSGGAYVQETTCKNVSIPIGDDDTDDFVNTTLYECPYTLAMHDA